MDKHPIVFLLLVLPFPIWPVFAYWLVGIVAKRKTALSVGLLAGLASVALAVGFFVVFQQWLEEPLYARVAALIYGCPAVFFVLVGEIKGDAVLFRRRYKGLRELAKYQKPLFLLWFFPFRLMVSGE